MLSVITLVSQYPVGQNVKISLISRDTLPALINDWQQNDVVLKIENETDKAYEVSFDAEIKTPDGNFDIIAAGSRFEKVPIFEIEPMSSEIFGTDSLFPEISFNFNRLELDSVEDDTAKLRRGLHTICVTVRDARNAEELFPSSCDNVVIE